MTKPTLNEIENFFAGKPVSTITTAKPTVGFKRLSEDAVLPTKAFPTDSGWDLTAVEDVIVEPGETVVVKTGIAVELPAGYEAQIRPRSGITSRTKLRVQLGTIDQSYTGEIGVIVDNIAQGGSEFNSYLTVEPVLTPHFSRKYAQGTYLIRKNDRIAQLVITKLPTLEAVEITELRVSERGGNGFGSTGASV